MTNAATLRALLIGAIALAPAAAVAADPPVPTLQLFGSLTEARRHCPSDTVVRIILPEGFFLHGDRGMGGSSLAHVYVCNNEVSTLFQPPRKTTR